MDQIAFFWVGDDVSIPTLLVKSARLIYGDEVKIFQLSNKDTPEVSGVDNIYRGDLSPLIMVARLEAYCLLPENGQLTFFCDADSLVIGRLKLNEMKESKYLSLRKVDFAINAHFPEYYPEFEDKNFCQVMPFLFGAIAMREHEQEFNLLLDYCKQLPMRFQRWYGDQVALARRYHEAPDEFHFLDVDKLLGITREELSMEQLTLYRQNDVRFVTFKGPQSKSFIEPTYNNLKSILN